MAKIDGLLERAQLENLVGAPVGAQPTGRVIADVTAPATALPYFYNGTAWKLLAYSTTASGLVTQNSAKAVTVDWSTGLVQQVILTDNAVISFSNPQAGQTHQLIVTQNQTLSFGNGNTYLYTLNMVDQDSARLPYQPYQVLALAESRLHAWYYKSALKAAIPTVPANAYGTSAFTGVAHYGGNFKADGTAYISPRNSSPFWETAQIYDVTSTQQNPVGLPAQIVAATASGVGTGACFTPDGRAGFFASGTTPFIQGFYTNGFTPQGTAWTDPGTIPTGAAKCIAMHPTGNYVIVGHTTTPFMSAYPLTGQAYGTKITNPVTLPAAQVNSVEWAPTGDFLAVGSQTTPFIQVWPFSDAAGTGSFGAIVANPGSLPAGGPAAGLGKGIAWRPQADYIAMGMSTTPFLYVVPFNRATSTFGTALTVSGASIPAAINSVRWSPDGQYLICVGSTTGQTAFVIDFSSFTIGASVAFDGTAPSGIQCNDVSVSPNGQYMFIGQNASTWFQVFSLPQKQRNYLKLV